MFQVNIDMITSHKYYLQIFMHIFYIQFIIMHYSISHWPSAIRAAFSGYVVFALSFRL